MAKNPETKFTEKIDRELKATFGNDIFLENIQQVSKAGTPDRICCINGLFVSLEIKTEVGRASRLQQLKLAQIEKAGGYAAVVFPSTWPYVLEEIKSIVGY